MTGVPLQFGVEKFLPSRQYAEGWPQYTRERWPRYVAAYRSRVAEVYGDLAGQHPALFSLMVPLELLVVVSLVREWVFMRPAVTDVITLEERWEDPQLAQWDLIRRADHERQVRKATGISDEFRLLWVWNLNMPMPGGVDAAPIADNANPEHFGSDLADDHAGKALSVPALQSWAEALTGRTFDKTALTSLRGRMQEIKLLAGAARGYRFESLIVDLLKSHGCQVERGTPHDGEQIDVFVHKPFRAIIECRWSSDPLEPRAIGDLTTKLGRRPVDVAGIYISMTAYTDSSRKHALHEPNGRKVLLWDAGDVDRLLSGEVHALDLYEQHLNDRVRRYRLNPP